MDDWIPEREQPVTEEWLAAEHARLARRAEQRRTRLKVAEERANIAVNGSGRLPDGRFKNLPDRVFRTDGAQVLPPDDYQEVLLKIREQTRWPRVISPFDAMEVAVTMRRLCEDLEDEAVAFARGHGWSWRAVGDALGMTESGAHRRFAGDHRERERRQRR